MATVASPRNGISEGARYGTHTAYEMHTSVADENEAFGIAIPVTSNLPQTNQRGSPHAATPTGKDAATSDAFGLRRINGSGATHSDEDIPENMYRPEVEDPEGWIHRDKLAKIESEELQAAGINLANARARSQTSKSRGEKFSTRDDAGRREEKRLRLNSPPEVEDDVNQATWDFRLPDEINADHLDSASQMYASPVLRKSGSKIPIMTTSPLPISAERYERETPIARKRTASGTMSFEGDLVNSKMRIISSNRSPGDGDITAAAITSSTQSSPQRQRPLSATISPSTVKKNTPASRKVSTPIRATPSPNQRPGTRSGEQDRPRTAVNRPEGDPPWLIGMYKPDPRLPPDQQLIPTLAKKQQQAQWAEEGAVPKAYDRDFTPIAVHSNLDLTRDSLRQSRTPSPAKEDQRDITQPDHNTFNLRPVSSIRSNSGRPDTSGSITKGYSTMPKVVSPPLREGSFASPKISNGPLPSTTQGARSTTIPPPTRMQAQNLSMEEDGEKKTKSCGCCVVM